MNSCAVFRHSIPDEIVNSWSLAKDALSHTSGSSDAEGVSDDSDNDCEIPLIILLFSNTHDVFLFYKDGSRELRSEVMKFGGGPQTGPSFDTSAQIFKRIKSESLELDEDIFRPHKKAKRSM
jgi:hypothetical protein